MNLARARFVPFRDFSAARLVEVGGRIGKVLEGLPGQDTFHRELAADLAAEVARLAPLAPDREASALKPSREGLDEERAMLYTGLTRMIRAGCCHPFAAKADAAGRLRRVLDRHGLNAEATGSGDRTAELDLFFAGLDHAPFQTDLATLDLLTWYKKLRAVHVRYQEAEKEESCLIGDRSAAPPSMHEVRQRLSSLLGLIREGIRHQAERARAPYDRLAARLEEAIHGTAGMSPRPPRGQGPGRPEVSEPAALNG